LKGANDVCLDKLAGAMNGAVHVRFGCKIHNGARLVLEKESTNKLVISDVPSNEDMARVA
jgi:hypothetical protein